MKLSKLLIPTVSVASIATIVAPTATSCACSLLKYLPANLMNISTDEFGMVTLYGFKDSVSEYQKSKYKIFGVPDAVQQIAPSAFYDINNQKTTLADSIKELKFETYYLDEHSKINIIGSMAFKNAPFEKVTFPYVGNKESNQIDMYELAFDGCAKLTEIDFSSVYNYNQISKINYINVFGSTGQNQGVIYISTPRSESTSELDWIRQWTLVLKSLGMTIDDSHWKVVIKK